MIWYFLEWSIISLGENRSDASLCPKLGSTMVIKLEQFFIFYFSIYNRLRYLKNIFMGGGWWGVDAVSHPGYLQDWHVGILAVFYYK